MKGAPLYSGAPSQSGRLLCSKKIDAICRGVAGLFQSLRPRQGVFSGPGEKILRLLRGMSCKPSSSGRKKQSDPMSLSPGMMVLSFSFLQSSTVSTGGGAGSNAPVAAKRRLPLSIEPFPLKCSAPLTGPRSARFHPPFEWDKKRDAARRPRLSLELTTG